MPVGKVRVCDFEPYRMYPGQIDAGNFSDYGLCVYFKAPKSYTGEDIVEFQCHGGESVARGILKKTFSLGARSAGKGEFWTYVLERETVLGVGGRRCGYDKRRVGGGSEGRLSFV